MTWLNVPGDVKDYPVAHVILSISAGTDTLYVGAWDYNLLNVEILARLGVTVALRVN